MHAITRERSRSEGGFTLIELLVVMIIIAILMAVAIPTFLSQKNSALKTQATSNIKQVVNAIESCAAQIPQGGYKDPAAGSTYDCSTAATLTGFEKSLSNLNIGTAAPTAPGAFHVGLTGDNQGYIVQTMIKDSGQDVFFAEIHASDGGLYKVCKGTSGFAVTDSVGAAVPASKSCKTGKWG
jgi:prepilin-type N-terminal cleavage/methylation domain-containing protein